MQLKKKKKKEDLKKNDEALKDNDMVYKKNQSISISQKSRSKN